MVEPELFPNQPPAPSHSSQHTRQQQDSRLLELRERVTEIASRLAVLEERAGNLRKKGQNTDQSLLEYSRETRADLKALRERLTELARVVEDVREKVEAMAGELGSVVKRQEFSVLERYLDLWQPLNFITREEAKMLLKEAKGTLKEAKK